MSSRLRVVLTALVFLAEIGAADGRPVLVKEAGSEAGIALQTILEVAQTARLLAILLDSGRSVINEHHAQFDEPGKSDKGLTPDVLERQLIDICRSRSGIDLQDLHSPRVPTQAKKLMKETRGSGAAGRGRRAG